MSNSKLIELSYYDPSAQVRLSAYADTIVLDHDQNGSIISAIRFGGYPEMVRAMADAIYGGATIEAAQNDTTRMLQSSLKSYQRQITHDGIYAVATLMAADTVQEDDRSGKHEKDEDTNLVDTEQMELQPRRCYIFCPARDQKRLFEELDHKTAAPLIPEFQDYVLSSLRQRGDLRQLEVISLKERMDAWVLDLKPQDQNVVEVLEQGLQSGDIQIPGAVPNMPDVFENVENVTGYLNTFGVTVADRIRNQFMPLFDPAKEPLSDEVLAINDCIMSRVGYSLYDAQLAVAEAVKRQLARKRVALIIAECGSGKTKIGSTALGALHGLWADQKRKDGRKSFGIVMCPSHVTQKWVREIGETLPDTYGMVVRTIQDLNRLYAMYEKGDKSVFAVFSKEQARDGYMRYPAVRWNRRRRAFLCPDCDGVIEMEISEDGSRYTVPADQFFFQKEHKKNHTCPHCGTPLWSAVNPDKRIDWVKIGEYGWVYRYGAQAHLHRTKNERVLDQLTEIAQNPDAFYPIRGAHQRFPLSTYIKKKLRGRIDGFLCDELHEYNNNSGQGDAMAELYGASRCFVGMTATLNLQYMERLPIKKKGVTMHLGERFCVAGKRARKFKRSDPKTYVPSWCPRLKAPCELRIYGFKNQREWRMHRSMCAYLGEDTSPSAFRYAVRYEGHTDLAPYEFFECCNEKSDDEILGAAVQHYDVVEIDDGIKPAFFYKTEHGYELLFSFDAKTAKKNIREEID